jgi:hypothetical protein
MTVRSEPNGVTAIGDSPLDILEIHPGLACQLRCNFCWREGSTYHETAPVLQEDRLDEILAEFKAQGGHELWLSGGVEPFSNPAMACRAIVGAHRLGLCIKVYSNGLAPALGEPFVRAIVATYPDWVRWSVHAATEKTFQAVARPHDPRLALRDGVKNIEAMSAARPAGTTHKVGVGFLVLPENAGEVVQAAEFWSGRVDFFDVRADARMDRSGNEAIRRGLAAFRVAQEAGRFGPLEIHLGDALTGPLQRPPFCYAPSHKLVMDPFGLVWTCCTHAHPGMRPAWARAGNLAVEDLHTIVARLKSRLPLPHCTVCCPGDIAMNLKACAQLRQGVPARSQEGR